MRLLAFPLRLRGRGHPKLLRRRLAEQGSKLTRVAGMNLSMVDENVEDGGPPWAAGAQGARCTEKEPVAVFQLSSSILSLVFIPFQQARPFVAGHHSCCPPMWRSGCLGEQGTSRCWGSDQWQCGHASAKSSRSQKCACRESNPGHKHGRLV